MMISSCNQNGGSAMNTVGATNTSANSPIASLIKDAASSGSALASQGSTSSSSGAALAENKDVKEFYLGMSSEGPKSFRDTKSCRR